MDTEPADTLPPEEVTIETPAGTIRWQDFIRKLSGSYFDHPDCRVAVEDHEDDEMLHVKHTA